LSKDERKMLEELIINNPDLERLESLLGEFNIFDAIGVRRQELRHSDFLAYLLDPNKSRGLGETFSKKLLQKAIQNSGASKPSISLFELDEMSLTSMRVSREWNNIDIFLRDDSHGFAVVVENKLDTGEHDDQLKRYQQAVEKQYPKFIGLYLTIDGSIPQEYEGTDYLPIDYRIICGLLENISVTKSSTINSNVRLLIEHYVEMLRRHIVNDSEIDKLCQSIYDNHTDALKLIYERKRDQQSLIRELVVELINSERSIELENDTKSSIYFAIKKWDTIRSLKFDSNSWARSGRLLLFIFDNYANVLTLRLIICSGDVDIQQKIIDWVNSQEKVFNKHPKAPNKTSTTIYSQQFISSRTYKELSSEELDARVRVEWDDFVENKLPKIAETILAADFS